MEIDKALLSRVSEVARIEFSDEELDRFLAEFKEVLNAFSEIDEVDAGDVEPSYQPVKLRNALREDVVRESLSQADALKNAEHTHDGYFKGPKIL